MTRLLHNFSTMPILVFSIKCVVLFGRVLILSTSRLNGSLAIVIADNEKIKKIVIVIASILGIFTMAFHNL